MSARPASAETAAREAALQMIYALDLGGQNAAQVEHWYLEAHPLAPVAALRARTLVEAVVERQTELEALIGRHAIGWRLERMNVVDRSLLKLAGAEMLLQPESGRRAIIAAAIKLARKFSQLEAVRFVQGVLEAMAQELAPEAEEARHG
ncbi:MAG: transcription antitermination factor NusB [Terriglobales bacterium]